MNRGRDPNIVQRYGASCDRRTRCIALNGKRKRCGNPAVVEEQFCPIHLWDFAEATDVLPLDTVGGPVVPDARDMLRIMKGEPQ